MATERKKQQDRERMQRNREDQARKNKHFDEVFSALYLVLNDINHCDAHGEEVTLMDRTAESVRYAITSFLGETGE